LTDRQQEPRDGGFTEAPDNVNNHIDDPVKIVNMVSPAPRDTWESVLRSDPFALESQSPAWAAAMCDARGFRDVSRLYETADGRTLVLPLLRRSVAGGMVTFDRSNQPDCGVGGLLAPGGASAEEIAAVLDDLSRRRVLVQSVSPGPLLAPAWSAAAPARAITVAHRAHVLDLAEGWEQVSSKHFTSHSRWARRRAERAGVTVECGTSGRGVPEFYQLVELAVVRWARKQNEPLWLARHRLNRRDPRAKFEAMGRFLRERFRIYLAYFEGRTIAGNVVVLGTNAYGYRAAMDETMAKTRANDLLHFHMIEDACRAGCRYFYMGDSGRSAGAAAYKERFGAQPQPYPEYRFERLPISRTEHLIKSGIKKAIGFKD
jgi:CelD/BcsL family acetyltransferase involved in cellulose biosynthesis